MQMMTEPKTGTKMEPMVQVFKLVLICWFFNFCYNMQINHSAIGRTYRIGGKILAARGCPHRQKNRILRFYRSRPSLMPVRCS